MGEVFLADDLILGRRVALKFLSADLLHDSKLVGRFEREARTVSALNHPNILTIHELGLEGDERFLVTEFIEGATLRDRLKGRLGVSETLDIAIGVATGLAAAHRAGVVHRDLKPENVMIRTDGVVKLLDFGIAGLSERAAATFTTMLAMEPGHAVGTLPYMSPEQLRAQPTDGRTDIYSFGVVLFELLSGRLPFTVPNRADLVAAILGQDAPPLSRAVVDVPADLDRLVASALGKDPATRPNDMSEVLTALTQLQRSLSREPARPAIVDTGVREAAPRTNLPADLTPLLGRDIELDQLTRLLRDDGVRLVTLTGAGGSGKTRLAIAAAQRLDGDFADGIVFVGLGAILDPALVAPTIGQALEVKEGPGESPVAALHRHVAKRELLIVIDNFEQLLDAGHVLTGLLAGASRLTVLATSQAALRVRGEREFPVAPLLVPGTRDSLESLRTNPAVSLLVSRVQDVNASFALTEENADSVVEICRRLDGLPLAIELTASRLKVLSPAAVLRKLDEPLAFLTAGRRDLPPRQQTMRNAIEWSYAQLTSSEQALFRRLAVFNGGHTAEAVEAIGALHAGLDDDVLERFASIVDKSLVRRGSDQAGEPRFSMLTTIHRFAADLLDPQEAAELRRRHAAYFLALIEKVESEVLDGSDAAWLRRLEREFHNIRAALSWCVDTGQWQVALGTTVSLLPFWLRRGHIAEGRGYLSRLLAATHASDEPTRMKALYAAGVLAEAQGAFVEARGCFEENLAAHRRRSDAWGIANALNNLGVICLRLEQYVDARAFYGESLEVWRGLGNRPAVALSLQNLGNIARLEKRFDDARTLYDASLADFTAMHAELGVAKALSLLSDLAREEGTLDRARQLGEASLAILMKLTEHREVAMCLADLGRIERESHNVVEAYSLYQESLLIFLQLGDSLGLAHMLEALGNLVATEGKPAEAIRIAASADRLREAAGVPPSAQERSLTDGWLQPARHSVGAARAADLWREGGALSIDGAVALIERVRLG